MAGNGTKVSPTLRVLMEIRDHLQALERRQTETEVRLATELVAVTKAVDGVRDLLRDRLDLKDKVDDHERRLMAVERKVG